MAINVTTPGVYVQEVPSLPPSVVGVPTSIPVFIGYTDKAIIDGTAWNFAAGATPPVRIESLLDFVSVFGGPKNEPFTATISNATPPVYAAGGTISKFELYYHLQMFYANGGGVCWVVAADSFANSITSAKLIAALSEAEKADDAALVVIPETMTLSVDADRKAVNDAVLAHCAKLQDRFAILDTEDGTGAPSADASDFRDKHVGINNLKYGAAYYPRLNTVLYRSYNDADVVVTDSRAGSLYTAPNNTLAVFKSGSKASIKLTVTSFTFDAGENLVFTILPSTSLASVSLASVTNNSQLAAAINASVPLKAYLSAAVSGSDVIITMNTAGAAGNGIIKVEESDNTTTDNITFLPATGIIGGAVNPDTESYNKLVSVIQAAGALKLAPSSSMAGIYAAVDNQRGVWKAPANVSINNVVTLTTNLSNQQQEGLNVDATSGKSINALRFFAGKGNIVWGARTLAGNDNEWRYVNVRRLFLYVEKSVKLSMGSQVFETNDKNTWVRMKGMISSFLSDLWAKGGLQGSKADNAFFVHVGLGETMTADDVLNGKVVIRIGMAAVRPAEFIVLEFQHMLPTA